MAAISTKQAVEDPRQALLRQNRELMEVLLMLQEQNQRLQDANQELEVTNQGVVALNLELTNTADQLAAAARLKSEFLSNMSHEIRTPMNGVIGMTTLLESTEMSGEQKEFVSIIRTCGENLLTIINDILDYSKIDSGKLELESRAFCLESVAEQALELVTPAAASQGIHLGLRIGDGVPRWITGDQVRLSQILLNLISNAVKFTRRGSVTLALEREDPISGAPQLRADIIDTGVGISSSKLERLFQPFSQVDSSTTRVFGGTGLGLAIVKRLAELMGGNVAVRSTEGAGSVFTVCIPLRSSSCPDLYSEPDLPAHSRLLLAANAKDAPVLMSVLHRSGIAPAAICLPASTREFLDRAGPFDALATTELLANFPSTPTLVLLPDFRQNCPQHPLHTVFLPHGPRKIAAALRSLLAPAAISASRPSAVSLTRRSQPRPMHVLVADDSRINQRVASHLLKALGHTFELALNGRIALDMTVSGAFDAVLLDMHMPEMDGYQVSAELKRRANSGTQVPFVIAFTAAAMEEDRQRCLNAGASAYLTKPVNLEKLAAALALAGQQPTPV
jgi:signal transduction histidine kinase/CheY-like chemotaxis protein